MLSKLSVVLFLLVGCGTSIRTTTINASPRPLAPRDPATVELFTSGAPPRPHVDVALFEAEESSSFSVEGTPEMLGHLRTRGARLGCDAVVIGGMSSRDPGLADTESWLVKNPKSRKGIYATCIVYVDEPPAGYAAAAPVVAPPAAPAPAQPPMAAPATSEPAPIE